MAETEPARAEHGPEASGLRAARSSYWVCLLPFLVTAGRFRNGFVFDDVFIIGSDFIFDPKNLPRALVNRAMIASTLDKAVGRPGMDTYRPLSIASFFWDAALSGHEPWSFHLTNALLHCTVCALLLALLRGLFPDLGRRYQVAGVAWFGLAPWLSEAHVWINGRSDPLLAIGFLLSSLCMRRALAERRLALGIAAAGAAFAALASKEIAVVLLPFVAAVPVERSARVRERLRYGWPLVAAFLVYLGLRMYSLSGLRSHSGGAQLSLAAKQLPLVLGDGLVRLLVPTPYFLRNMRDDYAALPAWLGIGAWLALLSALALLLRFVISLARGNARSDRHGYALIWGIALALASLAPAAMISTNLWPGFGRYLYVPALGLSVALAAALQLWLNRSASARRFAWPALSAYVALCGVLLVDATLSFVSEETLYQRAIAERPEQAWTYGFLGLSLRREGRCSEAIPALNRAATMDAGEARYALRLGQCLLETGAVAPARHVAEAGRARFAGTRSEPGFLLLLARSLPNARRDEQRALMRRCLEVDAERSDCRALLELIEQGPASSTSRAHASPWD